MLFWVLMLMMLPTYRWDGEYRRAEQLADNPTVLGDTYEPQCCGGGIPPPPPPPPGKGDG